MRILKLSPEPLLVVAAIREELDDVFYALFFLKRAFRILGFGEPSPVKSLNAGDEVYKAIF